MNQDGTGGGICSQLELRQQTGCRAVEQKVDLSQPFASQLTGTWTEPGFARMEMFRGPDTSKAAVTLGVITTHLVHLPPLQVGGGCGGWGGLGLPAAPPVQSRELQLLQLRQVPYTCPHVVLRIIVKGGCYYGYFYRCEN